MVWQVAALISQSVSLGAVLSATAQCNACVKQAQQGDPEGAHRHMRLWMPAGGLVFGSSAVVLVCSIAAYRHGGHINWLYVSVLNGAVLGFSSLFVLPGPIKTLADPNAKASDVTPALEKLQAQSLARLLVVLGAFALATWTFCPSTCRKSGRCLFGSRPATDAANAVGSAAANVTTAAADVTSAAANAVSKAAKKL